MPTTNRNLPSLDFVRGFEAAARHLSFTKAAAELFVTQSAISRQIKALEERLGVPLFQRRHRALALTEAGRHFQQAVSDALRLLNDAARRIRSPDTRLTVSATIGFTSLWLIPRLGAFRAAHPDVDIRIDANNRLIDLARDEVDVAIRYGAPELVPPDAVRLFGEQVIVACHPRLARRIARPADVLRHVLLHFDRTDGAAPWLSWDVWLEVHGLAGQKPAGSLSYTAFDHLVQAAMDGQGLALGPTPLLRRLIAAGRLVAPLREAADSARAYYLLIEPNAAVRPQVKQFVAWLLQQAQEEAQTSAEQLYGAEGARRHGRAGSATRRAARR